MCDRMLRAACRRGLTTVRLAHVVFCEYLALCRQPMLNILAVL